MRKEYGSRVCQLAGIYVASRLLRHSGIRITSKHYLDDNRRIVSGLGVVFGDLRSLQAEGEAETEAPIDQQELTVACKRCADHLLKLAG